MTTSIKLLPAWIK